jgi:hypothetical protein
MSKNEDVTRRVSINPPVFAENSSGRHAGIHSGSLCTHAWPRRFPKVTNVRYMRLQLEQGAGVQVISEASTINANDVGTPARVRRGRIGFGALALLASVAALVTAGCSNEPLQPQGALWTGASKARVGTSRAGSVSDTTPLISGTGSVSSGGWPYSGRRRQTSPPPIENYAFKGDPNASGTFAPRPAQM